MGNLGNRRTYMKIRRGYLPYKHVCSCLDEYKEYTVTGSASTPVRLSVIQNCLTADAGLVQVIDLIFWIPLGFVSLIAMLSSDRSGSPWTSSSPAHCPAKNHLAKPNHPTLQVSSVILFLVFIFDLFRTFSNILPRMKRVQFNRFGVPPGYSPLHIQI